MILNDWLIGDRHRHLNEHKMVGAMNVQYTVEKMKY